MIPSLSDSRVLLWNRSYIYELIFKHDSKCEDEVKCQYEISESESILAILKSHGTDRNHRNGIRNFWGLVGSIPESDGIGSDAVPKMVGSVPGAEWVPQCSTSRDRMYSLVFRLDHFSFLCSKKYFHIIRHLSLKF